MSGPVDYSDGFTTVCYAPAQPGRQLLTADVQHFDHQGPGKDSLEKDVINCEAPMPLGPLSVYWVLGLVGCLVVVFPL